MTDYAELVKELRGFSSWEIEPHKAVMKKAADAVEDLEFACNRYEKDYKALCAYLPKWTPVTERLPEAGERVLCYCRANIYEVMKMRTDGGWVHIDQLYDSAFMGGFVTHWMPLPTPPKEETE